MVIPDNMARNTDIVIGFTIHIPMIAKKTTTKNKNRKTVGTNLASPMLIKTKKKKNIEILHSIFRMVFICTANCSLD